MKIIPNTRKFCTHILPSGNEIYLHSIGSLWDKICAVQPSTTSCIGAENGA